MRAILISSQKGGVGKTATSWSIASGLAARGYRVLAIDSDPQCNLSFVSGIVDTFSVEASLANIYAGDKETRECIIKTDSGYDLICGSVELTAADLMYSGRTGREYILRKGLEQINDEYDYCVIDTPPFVGLLVQNALALNCPTDIIVPINPDVLSVQALTYYVQLIGDIKGGLLDSQTRIAGVLVTKVNSESSRSATEKKMLSLIEGGTEANGLHLYQTRIRESKTVSASMLAQNDVFHFAPKSIASEDYTHFIDEYLEV